MFIENNQSINNSINIKIIIIEKLIEKKNVQKKMFNFKKTLSEVKF